MGAILPPQPAPAPATSHDGPPDDLSLPLRLAYRPRDLYDCGVGPWRNCWFQSHAERVLFVTTWQHDFELKLPDAP